MLLVLGYEKKKGEKLTIDDLQNSQNHRRFCGPRRDHINFQDPHGIVMLSKKCAHELFVSLDSVFEKER